MTPRFARLAGWSLLAGVVGLVVACATPAVDGTDLDGTDEAPSTSKKKKSTNDDTPAKTPTKPRTVPTASTKPADSTPSAPVTAPTATTTPPTAASSSAPPVTTPPPVTQPNCTAGGDPTACLDCCLDANLGAVGIENNYSDCLNAGVDPDTCKSEHLDACAGNTACKANHACMEANNCLANNLCAP